VLQRIGERTALGFYQHYLGDNREEYSQFPLAVYEPGCERFTLRDPFLLDEASETITFIGTIHPDAQVQLAEVGLDDVVEAAHDTIREALAGYPGDRPSAVLIFSCTSRRHLLGSRACEECRALREMKEPPPFFGFYTYGEIGNFDPAGPVHYHNDTYVVVVLGVD
jgi:hypothetical protein